METSNTAAAALKNLRARCTDRYGEDNTYRPGLRCDIGLVAYDAWIVDQEITDDALVARVMDITGADEKMVRRVLAEDGML